MPESPRYQAQVQGRAARAASQLADFTSGKVGGDGSGVVRQEMGLRAFLTNRRYLIMLAGTAYTLGSCSTTPITGTRSLPRRSSA